MRLKGCAVPRNVVCLNALGYTASANLGPDGRLHSRSKKPKRCVGHSGLVCNETREKDGHPLLSSCDSGPQWVVATVSRVKWRLQSRVSIERVASRGSPFSKKSCWKQSWQRYSPSAMTCGTSRMWSPQRMQAGLLVEIVLRKVERNRGHIVSNSRISGAGRR